MIVKVKNVQHQSEPSCVTDIMLKGQEKLRFRFIHQREHERNAEIENFNNVMLPFRDGLLEQEWNILTYVDIEQRVTSG